jgi:hypothetical protein
VVVPIHLQLSLLSLSLNISLQSRMASEGLMDARKGVGISTQFVLLSMCLIACDRVVVGGPDADVVHFDLCAI